MISSRMTLALATLVGALGLVEARPARAQSTDPAKQQFVAMLGQSVDTAKKPPGKPAPPGKPEDRPPASRGKPSK